MEASAVVEEEVELPLPFDALNLHSHSDSSKSSTSVYISCYAEFFMPPLLFPQQIPILSLIVLAVFSPWASMVFPILSFQTSSHLLHLQSVPGGHSGSPFSPLAPGSTI